MDANILDDSFENKDSIAMDIKKELSEEMSSYGYTIIKSLVVDINPEENVKCSMNEINAAQRQLEATKAKAEADRKAKLEEQMKAKLEARRKEQKKQQELENQRKIAEKQKQQKLEEQRKKELQNKKAK